MELPVPLAPLGAPDVDGVLDGGLTGALGLVPGLVDGMDLFNVVPGKLPCSLALGDCACLPAMVAIKNASVKTMIIAKITQAKLRPPRSGKSGVPTILSSCCVAMIVTS